MCLTASRQHRYKDLYLHVSAHVAYLVVLASDANLQVTWQPYETDEVKGMALNAICKRDQELWRVELLLICYYVIEWHLPNRVVRQFDGCKLLSCSMRQQANICISKSYGLDLCVISFSAKLTGFDINLLFLFRAQDKPEKGQGYDRLDYAAHDLYRLVERESEKSPVLPPWRME
jgi:hypothetical protein